MFHPLMKRAVDHQTRLEAFKRDFNIFYKKALRTFGKWKTNSEPLTIGSNVYILDKTTAKANFFQKFRLGRISRYLSQHTVELTYMNQLEKEGTSQGLIRELRTGRLAKVTLKKCVRDLRDLSVVIDPSKESEWAKGVDIDLLIADQVQEEQQGDDQEDDQGQAQEEAPEDPQEKSHEEVEPAPAAPAPAASPPAPAVPAATPATIVPVDSIVHNAPVAVSHLGEGRPIRQRVKPRRYR